VKHFKHEIIGKKRIHRNPSRAEIAACRPWVLEELKIVQPQMIVCMGVSAATSILGRQVTLRDWRGRFFASALAPHTFVTAHPAGILRTVDPAEQEQAYLTFVSELRMIAERLHHLREVSERSPSDRNTNPNRT
jgi:DNA polymerase